MKKIISMFFVMFSLIPFLFISARAEVSDFETNILTSGYQLGIINKHEFNYIMVNEHAVNEIPMRLSLFSNEVAPDDATFTISVGNGFYLEIEYSIDRILKYTFDGRVFMEVSDESYNISNVDLRRYNKKFKLDTSFYDNDELFNKFMDYIGLNYLNVFYLYEEERIEEYTIYNSPDKSTLCDRNNYSEYQYTFIKGDYDCSVIGDYDFVVGTVTKTGKVYLINYKISITSNDILAGDEITVGYKDNISKNNYIKSHVFINDNHVDVTKCKVNSEYFKGINITLKEYIVNIEYEYNGHTLYGKGKIIVEDKLKPVIYGSDETTDYLSNSKDIDSILTLYEAYDEIDGDISANIEIENLNNYDSENPKVGNYRFKLYVEDNNSNKAEKIITYHIVADPPKPTTEPDTKPSTSSSTTTTIPSTTSTTKQIIPTTVSTIVVPKESSVVKSMTDEPTTIPSTITNTIVATSNSATSSSTTDKNIIVNDNKDYDIEFTIKTDTAKALNENDIKNKLIFYGLIPSDFNGEIVSDYFETPDEVGEYMITTKDSSSEHYFMIQVSNNKNSSVKEEKKENDNTMIITFGIIIGVVVLVFIVIIVVMNKKKLNN